MEEPRERTQWHHVAVFNAALGKVTMRYLKGSLVYLEGQLETRKWRGNDGADHYTTEVVLRPYRGEITMLDPAPRAPRPERQTRAPARKARTPAAAPAPGSRR
jgi:single-stranded DNA-binding protein